MNKKLKDLLITGIATLLGLLAIVAGEADDSPGLQGLGLLLIFSFLYLRIRRKRIRGARGTIKP